MKVRIFEWKRYKEVTATKAATMRVMANEVSKGQINQPNEKHSGLTKTDRWRERTKE